MSQAMTGPKDMSITVPIGAPVEDRPMVYVNGQIVPKHKAAVSVFDHGLLYGDGVFEGIRVYRGKIFLCGQHMDRLWRSAEALRIKIPISREEMIEVQRRCIELNEIEDGYIRLIITRGEGTLGLNPFKCPRAGVICIADQIALYPPELYEQGLKVIVAERPRVPIACLDPRIKSLNYLNNIMAKVEALDVGLLEAIMLNIEGEVSECTGDNIFIVKDGAIFTPPDHAGVLEGITRHFVTHTLAPKLGLTVTEKRMKIEEVLAADEVFLTGTAAEIIAVTQVDETVIGSGTEGPLTNKLRSRFREIVTSDSVPED